MDNYDERRMVALQQSGAVMNTEHTPLMRDHIRARLMETNGCPQHKAPQFMSIRPDGTCFCPTCGAKVFLPERDDDEPSS